MARFSLPHQDRRQLRQAISRQVDSSVVHGSLDEHLLDGMVAESPRFEKTVADTPEIGGEDYTPMPNLTKDVFYAQVSTDPEVAVRERGEMKPAEKFHAEVMQHYVNHPDFQKARARTRGDDLSSAVATMAAHNTMVEEVTRVKERGDEDTSQEDEHQRLVEYIQQLREQHANASTQEEKDEIKAKLKKAIGDRNQVENQMGQQGPQMGAGSVAAAGAQAAEDASDTLSKIPGIGEGNNRITVEEAMAAVQTVQASPLLKQVLDFVGRMERDFRYARSRRIVEGKEEIIGVKTGNEPDLLLPDEFVLLGDPVLELEFYRRYVEEQLLQFETQGEESAGKGPLVILRDCSGSMGAVENGGLTRHAWATVVSLSLSMIATRERRHVRIIDYEYGVSRDLHIPPKTRIDVKFMEEVANFIGGGGTWTDSAMQAALDIINDGGEFKQADVVLISDGDDHWSDDEQSNYRSEVTCSRKICEQLNAKGARVHSIIIGNGGQETEYIRKAADLTDGSACSVTDFTSPDAVRHIAVGMA